MAEKKRTVFAIELNQKAGGADGKTRPPTWVRADMCFNDRQLFFPTKREALEAGDALVEEWPDIIASRVVEQRWPAALTFSKKANQLLNMLSVINGEKVEGQNYAEQIEAEFKAWPTLWTEFRERAIPLLEKSLERLKKTEVFDD